MLVSSQTSVKGGHGFEIAVRMDNLRGGNWGEIQNNTHRIRSMHSRSSFFSKKRLLIPLLHMLACLVSIHGKM